MPVRVMRHNDAGVRVRLEGGPGLFGFVQRDYVTDDVLPTDPITGQVCCAVLCCAFVGKIVLVLIAAAAAAAAAVSASAVIVYGGGGACTFDRPYGSTYMLNGALGCRSTSLMFNFPCLCSLLAVPLIELFC